MITNKRTRVEYLLTLPLSDKRLPLYAHNKHSSTIINHHKPEDWLTLILSPLGGCIDVRHASEAAQAIDYVRGEAPAPKCSLPPGVVAELCIEVELYDAFEELMVTNEIAFDHIKRLKNLNGAITDDIGTAQSFAMAARLNAQALSIIKEIRDG